MLTAAEMSTFGSIRKALQDNGDFSFLVIGDPGEGDASQYSLASRYLKLGRNNDVKFLVILFRRHLSGRINRRL